jgi:hypothetical protein
MTWRAGHHQPNWETNELLNGETMNWRHHHQPAEKTNELLDGETNELETLGDPDTTRLGHK